jgi:hypothetical protein
VRRGLTLSAALIGADLVPQAAAAAMPGGLVAPTVKAALAFAVEKGSTAATSAQAVTVAQEVLRALFLARLKVGAAWFLALGFLIAGGALAVRQTFAAKQPAIQQKQNPPAAAQAGQLPAAPEEKHVVGTVVDPAGLPVPNATVWLLGGMRYDTPPKVVQRLTTNAAGEFALPHLPDQKAIDRGERPPSLIARDPQGRLGLLRTLRQGPGLDEPVRMRLVDVAEFKGRVVDGNGKPIVAAVAPHGRRTP